MAVQLNHTIVHAKDKAESAAFLAEILGLDPPEPFGPFLGVYTANDVTLDFIDADGEVLSQHYSFLVTEEEFDVIFGRIRDRGLEYWADPGRTEPGQTYEFNGGRGVYFPDPSGHFLEIQTRPYVDR